MAKVTIIRAQIDVLDQPGNVSLEEAQPDSFCCRLDFVAHNEGITKTVWGSDPATLLQTLEELLQCD